MFGQRAHAAAQLHRDRDGVEDRLDRRAVHRPALGRAVQVDHVQPLEAGRDPGPGLVGRVVVEHGRGGEVAVHHAHALAVLQVDGGIEDHGRHSRMLASSRSAGGLRLLRVELHAGHIAPHHGGGKASRRGRSRPRRRRRRLGKMAKEWVKYMCGAPAQAAEQRRRQRARPAHSSPCAAPCSADRRARCGARRPRSSRDPASRRTPARASASSCMPTQMPRNGAPRRLHRLGHRLDHAGRGPRSALMQAAKAPTPGSTTRSARAIRSRIVGRDDLAAPRKAGGGLLQRLLGRAQVARPVIDQGDALHGGVLPRARPWWRGRVRGSWGRARRPSAARGPAP